MHYGGEKRPTRDPANLQKALEIRGLAASAKVFLGSHECVVELMRFELTTSAVRLQWLWNFRCLPEISLVP